MLASPRHPLLLSGRPPLLLVSVPPASPLMRQPHYLWEGNLAPLVCRDLLARHQLWMLRNRSAAVMETYSLDFLALPLQLQLDDLRRGSESRISRAACSCAASRAGLRFRLNAVAAPETMHDSDLPTILMRA